MRRRELEYVPLRNTLYVCETRPCLCRPKRIWVNPVWIRSSLSSKRVGSTECCRHLAAHPPTLKLPKEPFPSFQQYFAPCNTQTPTIPAYLACRSGRNPKSSRQVCTDMFQCSNQPRGCRGRCDTLGGRCHECRVSSRCVKSDCSGLTLVLDVQSTSTNEMAVCALAAAKLQNRLLDIFQTRHYVRASLR